MPYPSEMTLMFKEAGSAYEVIARQLALNNAALHAVRRSFASSAPPLILTCARGSSDYAASYLRYIFETQLGLLSSSLAPSVSSLSAQWPHVSGSVCVAISQSGQSPDLLAVIKGMHSAGVRTIAVVNNTASPLGSAAEFLIPILAQAELSVAATKSFIGSLFASLQLARCIEPALVDESDLARAPDLLQQAWRLDWTPLVDYLVDATNLFVIGRGIGWGIAGEAALKFKETCNLHAEAFSAAEVQHGPMALFKEGFPVLIFRQNDASTSSIDALADLAVAQGCKVFVAGGQTAGATNLPCIKAPALLEPMLQIQTFYRAVNELAVRRGNNPDCPPLLRKETVTL